MAKNNKKRRRGYLDHFRPDDEGNYSYKGDLYSYQENGAPYQTVRTKLTVAGFLMLALLGIAGCLPAPGTDNSFYVLIPYVAALLGTVSVCWALVRLAAGGHPLRAYIYEGTVQALPERCVIVMAAAGAGVVLELLFVILNGILGKGIWCLLYELLNLAAFYLAFSIRHTILSMHWEKGNELKKMENAY